MRRVGRNRERHKRMPVGWAPAKSGAIYFRPTNELDREIVRTITGGPLSLKLGDTFDQAAETFATLIVAARRREEPATPGTVAEICARARLEYLPTIKNAKTRGERERHVETLERLFGTRRYARNVYEASRDTAGVYLRAMDVQRHLFECRESGPVSANRRVRTWELVFTWARAPWGLTEYNPCSGLMENEERPRRVVPEDDGIFRLYRYLDPPARFMVAMIRYYGRRKVEQLALQVTDARDDGIHFRRGKDRDAREIIVKWDRRLRRMWHRLMLWRAAKQRGGKVQTLAAIVNRQGRPYSETGFNSARKRAMERAGIKGTFTFHDIRKTRAQDGLTLEQAQNVLGHDEQRTTAVVYRPTAPIVVDLGNEVKRRKG